MATTTDGARARGAGISVMSVALVVSGFVG
jgi:hypothetical protein